MWPARPFTTEKPMSASSLSGLNQSSRRANRQLSEALTVSVVMARRRAARCMRSRSASAASSSAEPPHGIQRELEELGELGVDG
jgi:hypothetical protein